MGSKLIAGNWKMNGNRAGIERFAATLRQHLTAAPRGELLICPPAALVAPLVAALQGLPVAIGAQDCHAKASGAHTGDCAAPMFAELGCRFAIVGHSERRTDHGETDAAVAAKAAAALTAGLLPIVCVGETADERGRGQALEVVARQIAGSLPADADAGRLTVAYEPVWAIGSGATPTGAEIEEVHAHLRRCLTDRFGSAGSAIRLLYGGSVKPANAAEILRLRDVDGVLVGGASLAAEDFLAIQDACP